MVSQNWAFGVVFNVGFGVTNSAFGVGPVSSSSFAQAPRYERHGNFLLQGNQMAILKAKHLVGAMPRWPQQNFTISHAGTPFVM